MPTFNEVLSQVKSQIREVSVQQTEAALRETATDAPVVLDVRERDEYEQGFIPGAQWIPRGFLELKVEDAVPSPRRAVQSLVPRRAQAGDVDADELRAVRRRGPHGHAARTEAA
ncbi:MAG: rhodanese-like domain-containing protein [Myxococcota bacterium]